MLGEETAKRARAATQIEDTAWASSGEKEVEVRILSSRVGDVVNLCDLGVLIIHTLSRPQPILQSWPGAFGARRKR